MLNNLPTDNLYKFCAILGLSLMIFNTYYNFEMLNKSKSDICSYEGDLEKVIYDLEEIRNENLDFSSLIKVTLKNVKENKLNTTEKSKKVKMLDSINILLEAKNRLLIFRNIDLDVKKEKILNEKLKIKTYSSFLIFGSFLGIFLAIYGFYNWVRIQKYIDKTLHTNL